MPRRDQSYPRDLRLTKRPQFVSMNQQARRAVGRYFVVQWRPNGLAHSRLGITVTKKVAGAVGRNRLKRLARAAFRTAGDSLPQGLDLVVIAKPRAASLSGRAVIDELGQLWRSLESKP